MATTFNNSCLSSKDAAEYIGVSTRMLNNWRYRGTGPKYIRTGAVKSPVVYRIRELDAWLDEREDATERGGL